MNSLCKLAAVLAIATFARAQAGPNTLAKYNPGNRTMSLNATFCILPISKANAQAVAGHPLLDVPAKILPSFPEGMHPLLVQSGMDFDIRMTAANLVPLQIAALMAATVTVPFVDVTKDGKTPINVPVNSYIGGTNGQDLEALVPAIVASISPVEGTLTAPAHFAPDTEVAQTIPGGIYSAEVKPFLLPNPISGPGVLAEAIDILYTLTDKSPYKANTFHNLLNYPALLDNGYCQRNTLYFNETFTEPKMAVGNVTLYHQILDTPASAIAGVYTDVYCYQANGQEVSSTSESCAVAAAEYDPKARE